MFEEPQDLFEEKAPANLPIGGSTKPPLEVPPASVPPVTLPPQTVDTAPGTKSHKNLIVLFVVIIAVLLAAAFFAWKLLAQRASDTIVSEDVLEVQQEAIDEEQATEPTAAREQERQTVDSDGDGLSDARELELGTDMESSDTDEDGLGDRSEVEVYDTDPLNADTDGDSYLDGSEIENGYNPNGSGRLFQVP